MILLVNSNMLIFLLVPMFRVTAIKLKNTSMPQSGKVIQPGFQPQVKVEYGFEVKEHFNAAERQSDIAQVKVEYGFEVKEHFNAAERQSDIAQVKVEYGFEVKEHFNAAERQSDTAWGFNPRLRWNTGLRPEGARGS